MGDGGKGVLVSNQVAHKVLQYHTDKLKVLVELPPPEQRVYDPKWTFISRIDVQSK